MQLGKLYSLFFIGHLINLECALAILDTSNPLLYLFQSFRLGNAGLTFEYIMLKLASN